jgi:hypothetical protein
MNGRDYRRKFAAYHDYLDRERYLQEYDAYPTILMVTSDGTAEVRIARAARAVAVGRTRMLPLLLTCQRRVDRSPVGILGPVWREAGEDGGARLPWPVGAYEPGQPALRR